MGGGGGAGAPGALAGLELGAGAPGSVQRAALQARPFVPREVRAQAAAQAERAAQAAQAARAARAVQAAAGHSVEAAGAGGRGSGGGGGGALAPGGGSSIERAKRFNYRMKDARDWRQILRTIELHVETFNEVNLATALHRLAKVSPRPPDKRAVCADPRLALLEACALDKIRGFSPQQLSNSAWALATLGRLALPLLEAIEAQACERMPEFNSQDLSNTIWAFARLNHKPRQLMRAVAAEAQRKLRDFNPQGMANTLWAFATLAHFGEQHPALMQAVAGEALRKMHLFNPQNLANTAWAYARVGHHPGAVVLEAVAHHSAQQLSSFKPQEMANLIWAFAKLGHRSELFQAQLASAAAEKLPLFNPQNLANTVWAFATLLAGQPPSPAERRFVALMLPRTANCLPEFSQQGLSNTMWALAKLEISPGEELLARVAEQAAERISSFSPQGFVNLAWAFAVFGAYPPRLWVAVAVQATSKVHHLTAQDIASLTWAAAVFRQAAPPEETAALVDLLAPAAVNKLPYFSSQGLGDIIWALAALNHADTVPFRALWDMAAASVFALRDLCQVNRAVELLRASDPQGGLPPYLEGSLILRAAQAAAMVSSAQAAGSGGSPPGTAGAGPGPPPTGGARDLSAAGAALAGGAQLPQGRAELPVGRLGVATLGGGAGGGSAQAAGGGGGGGANSSIWGDSGLAPQAAYAQLAPRRGEGPLGAVGRTQSAQAPLPPEVLYGLTSAEEWGHEHSPRAGVLMQRPGGPGGGAGALGLYGEQLLSEALTQNLGTGQPRQGLGGDGGGRSALPSAEADIAAAQLRSISLQSSRAPPGAALAQQQQQQQQQPLPPSYVGERRPSGAVAPGGGIWQGQGQPTAQLYGAGGAGAFAGAAPLSARPQHPGGAASAFTRLPSASEILTPRSNLLANIWGDAPDSAGGGAGRGHPGAVRRVQSTHVPGSPGAVHYALPREFHPAAAAAAAAPPGGDAPGDWAEKMESLLQNLEK